MIDAPEPNVACQLCEDDAMTRHNLTRIVAVSGWLLSVGILLAQGTTQLSDAEVESIVRRSYQYVAMYNVNNKFGK